MMFRNGVVTIECLAHYDDYLFDKKQLVLEEQESDTYNSGYNRPRQHSSRGFQSNSNRRSWEDSDDSVMSLKKFKLLKFYACCLFSSTPIGRGLHQANALEESRRVMMLMSFMPGSWIWLILPDMSIQECHMTSSLDT